VATFWELGISFCGTKPVEAQLKKRNEITDRNLYLFNFFLLKLEYNPSGLQTTTDSFISLNEVPPHPSLSPRGEENFVLEKNAFVLILDFELKFCILLFKL